MMVDELGLVIVDTMNDIDVRSPRLIDRVAGRLHAIDVVESTARGARADIIGMVTPLLRVHHGL